MKIKEIISETSTTSGSIAPFVTSNMPAIKRGGNLLVGKKTSKKYENSLKEWSSYGFSVRSDYLWPAKMFEDSNSNKYSQFESWFNSQRNKIQKPEKGQKCILALVVNTGDSINIFYGDVKYIGQNDEKYHLEIPKGTFEYNKKNQIVFPTEKDFNNFLLHLNLKFDLPINKEKQAVVESTQLEEQDLIINPHSISKRHRDLIQKKDVRTDHEIEMARSDLIQCFKNSKKLYDLVKNKTEEEGLPAWVQEKIIKANDYLNTIREYLEGQEYENQEEEHDCGCEEPCDCHELEEVNWKHAMGAAALGAAGLMSTMSDPAKNEPVLKAIQAQMVAAQKQGDNNTVLQLKKDYKRAKDSIDLDRGIPSDILKKYSQLNEDMSIEDAVEEAKRIVSEFKHADMHMDIITKIQELADSVGIDTETVEYAIGDVLEKQKDLESAIFSLVDLFTDESYSRNLKKEIDDENLQEAKKKKSSGEEKKYRIGMAVAKKQAGYGEKPAHDLPKSVITKAHKIAKKIK